MDERSIDLADVAFEIGDIELSAKLYQDALTKLRQYNGDSMAPAYMASSLVKKIAKTKQIMNNEVPILKKEYWKLSKGSYIKGLQCHKYLYLDKYKKNKRTPPSKEKLSSFEKGHSFEDHFRKTVFPIAVNVKEKLGTNFNYLNSYTKYLFSSLPDIILYEGTIIENEILVMTDVIRKNNNDSYDFYEIKSHETLNDVIWNDLSIQYYVNKSRFGNKINTFNIVLRKNENDWQIIDLKEQLEDRIIGIETKINKLKSIVGCVDEPNIKMSNHCNSPYECEFINYCNNIKL